MLSSISPSTAEGMEAREAWRKGLIWEKSNPAYAQSIERYLSRYNDTELLSALTAMRAQAGKPSQQSYESKEIQRGYSALNANNVAEADKQFQTALSKDEKNGRAHAGLGFTRMKAENFKGAIDELDLAHKALPNDAKIKNALDAARFWQAMREGAKAIDASEWTVATQEYQRALSIRPNSEEAARGFGGALLAAGSPAKALPYLERVTRSTTSDEAAWHAYISAKLRPKAVKQRLPL